MNTHDITTLSDRELLELAAKAAGLKIIADGAYNKGVIIDLPRGRSALWNPLHNDGDAFRLAVRLNLIIEPPRDNGFAHVYHYHRSLEVAERRSAITHEAELTATRRAIVRAAAEIGKKMP